MKSTAIALLRKIGLLEGVSFLLLLGVAMPLKYFADLPMAVRYAGLAHGILFVVFTLALVQATLAARWPLGRAFLLFGAAVIPFGPFLAEPWLRREQQAASAPAQTTATG